MKPSEFKKILKPLIKQTIKEVLFEEGVLSNVVAEVAKGLQGNIVTEAYSSKENRKQTKREEEYERKRQERIKRLNESAKNQMGFDPYEGTKNIPTQSSTQGALSGISSSDPGVDITDIEKLSNGKWKRLI